MKHIFRSLALITLALSLIQCNDDQKDYYSALGMLQISNDSSWIDTDDGEILLVQNRNSIGNELKHNDRVTATFSLVKKNPAENIDYVIDLYSIEKLLFKPILVLTEQNTDSIGNDPLSVQSLWLSRNILNLSFVYYGGYQKHYINLIRYPGEIPADTIDLEIRHNDKDDTGMNYLNGFVSFDLQPLRNEPADSVILRIKAKEYNNRTFTKTITLK